MQRNITCAKNEQLHVTRAKNEQGERVSVKNDQVKRISAKNDQVEQLHVTDIFVVNKIGGNILKCNSNIKLTNITKEFKKLSEIEYKVYLYNNMNFMIDVKDNKKICESVEYVNNKLVGNKLLVDSIVKALHVYAFPFIDKYNDVVSRHIITYQNGISIINETNLKSNESLLFIRIDNQASLDKVLKLIE